MSGADIPFLKGHGTENDFVILPDPDGGLDLSPEIVARLCDRRAGVGADGVLRVVRAAAHPEGRAMAGAAEWFMDYRNADGSVAEMCGNGARVFVRYLQRAGALAEGDHRIATRAGVRPARVAKPAAGGSGATDRLGDITIGMGTATLPEGEMTVTVGERSWPARKVSMGNPHAVSFVSDVEQAGDLLTAPSLTPSTACPEGANIEFVAPVGRREITMRVHERGAGETRSCGTGACAAMVAAARRDGVDPADTGVTETYTVRVLGGRLLISEHPDGSIEMTGPAEIVAAGTLDADWLYGTAPRA